MNKIRKIGFAGISLIAGAMAPAALAQTVELYTSPYFYSPGGEFTAVTAPNVFNGNYAASALVNETDAHGAQVGFETFCVQTEVDFTPYNWGNTTPYNYGVSLSSVGLPDNFALSEGTAYLYWQFATGQLAGYDYTDAGTRTQDAGQLQAAIWALQGGQTYPGFPNGTGNGVTGNVFYNDALNFLGSSLINQDATTSDNFGVEIMNLTVAGNPNANAQNQLVYTGGGSNTHIQHAPDAGATLALMGVSLTALAGYSRRLAAKRA